MRTAVMALPTRRGTFAALLLALVASAGVSGCSFSPGAYRPPGVVDGDGGVDDDTPVTPVDVGPDAFACSSWAPAPKYFDPCAIAASGGPLTISSAQSPWKLDTTTGMLTNGAAGVVTVASSVVAQNNGPSMFVVSVDDLVVEPGATLVVVGDKPLVFAAWNSITVSGTLDASSRTASSIVGAGSNPAFCSSATPTTGQGALGVTDSDGGGGSGGGGGGGFRGSGGGGGPGDTNGQNAGGAGGGALGSFPMVVRGGCSGGASGEAGPSATSNGGVATRRAPGGAGGGAIQLTARNALTVATATILAGGGGGAGTLAGDANGGGGGGAGGYIGMEAPTTTITASTLAANGGAGGSSNLFSTAGFNGQDGQPSTTAAVGGQGSGTCANAGGNGGAGGTLNGATSSQTNVTCGGGGGGGATGYIGLFVTTPNIATSTISPALQQNPF